MIIHVDEIKAGGFLLESDVPPTTFALLKELASDGVFFEHPVHVALRIFRVTDMIEAAGHLETTVRLACGRCLTEYDHQIATNFNLTYVRELPVVEDEGGQEVELDADEMGLTVFDGDEIDCTEALQEQIVMALPLHPLCKGSCKGICPQCGANKNSEECSCTPEVFNSKFAALKNLKIDKKD